MVNGTVEGSRERFTVRLEAFSDLVFGFSLSLLATRLDVPARVEDIFDSTRWLAIIGTFGFVCASGSSIAAFFGIISSRGPSMRSLTSYSSSPSLFSLMRCKRFSRYKSYLASFTFMLAISPSFCSAFRSSVSAVFSNAVGIRMLPNDCATGAGP
jgi:hypothetical protein